MVGGEESQLGVRPVVVLKRLLLGRHHEKNQNLLMNFEAASARLIFQSDLFSEVFRDLGVSFEVGKVTFQFPFLFEQIVTRVWP